MEKSIFLVKNNTTFPFYISDCPVVMYNSFPYAGNSLFDKGVEIYLPISPDYIIGFCCKSLVSKIKKIVINGRTDVDPPRFNLLDAINEGVPVEVYDEEFVVFYNLQQILSSHKFIYSNQANFNLVSDVLKVMPEAKNRKTAMKMGEMGKGPPPNQNLPMGVQLVIYSFSDHNMLEIDIVEEIDGNILFTTEDIKTLGDVFKDTPLEKIELYKNQQMRRFIRGPELKLIDETNGIYELSNGDKGLKEVMNKILKDKLKK